MPPPCVDSSLIRTSRPLFGAGLHFFVMLSNIYLPAAIGSQLVVAAAAGSERRWTSAAVSERDLLQAQPCQL